MRFRSFILCLCPFIMGYGNIQVSPLAFDDIYVKGELLKRLEYNFMRLEEEKYQPHKVFLTMQQSGDWPGDTEGRTILGLVMDAQATHRTPRYLKDIMTLLPEHLNENGYMGPVFPDFMHEQQLAGNGWLLRGLCEYYLWTQEEWVLDIIKNIADNLFLKGKGCYARYPINPKERKRNIGAESGNISQTINGWKLSSDIGCVFIGMDGLIQAYEILKQASLVPVIDEMVNRFLQVDLLEIKAQTHASLTACRGLIRYADISGNQRYVNEAEKRFRLYMEYGMTENYENYNWFGRYDTWTEPCAIVDSYMLAVQLWQHTLNPDYLELAEKIYYNALCRTQRRNGGFGCDNCPGLAIKTPYLNVHTPEAHWCCTMRGGEGLSRVAEYTAFVDNGKIYIPFFRNAEFKYVSGFRSITFVESTDYPWGGKVKFLVKGNSLGKLTLCFPAYSWMKRIRMSINGKEIACNQQGRYLQLNTRLKAQDEIELHFVLETVCQRPVNRQNTRPDEMLLFYGPLQLCSDSDSHILLQNDTKLAPQSDGYFYSDDSDVHLKSIYHLMNPHIWESGKTPFQILFSKKKIRQE